MSSKTTSTPISRSAARLRWAVFAAMAAIVLLHIAEWLGPELAGVHIERHSHGPDAVSSRVIGEITVLLLLVALLRLSQMLGRIAAGQLFSAGVVGRFRSFAMWLLIMAVFSLVAPTLWQALTLPSSGARHLAVIVDLREVLTVGVTLLLFLLARLLERARVIDEEMREIV